MKKHKLEFEDINDKTFIMYVDNEPKCEFIYHGDGYIDVADLNGEPFKNESIAEKYLTMMLEQAPVEADNEIYGVKVQFEK